MLCSCGLPTHNRVLLDLIRFESLFFRMLYLRAVFDLNLDPSNIAIQLKFDTGVLGRLACDVTRHDWQ